MKKLLIVSAILVATAGFAQTETAAPPADDNQANPNDRICRIIHDIGSRLSRSRICMTRAEWREHRRLTQQNVERSQKVRVEKQY